MRFIQSASWKAVAIGASFGAAVGAVAWQLSRAERPSYPMRGPEDWKRIVPEPGSVLRPIGASGMRKLLGSFAYVAEPEYGNPERIRVTDGWDKHNIILVQVPQLIGIPGAPPDGRVLFNRDASPQLLALWNAWELAGLLSRVRSWHGSYSPRFVRGSTENLSNHAWGAAFDINAEENPLGGRPAEEGMPGSVRALVPIANSYGFAWGGEFRSRPDGMHFELAKLLPLS